MKHTGQVDRDDTLPFAGIEIEKSGGLTDADAVEQHIEPAKFAHRSRNRGVDGRAVAHVEAERCTAAPCGTDLRSGRVGRGTIDISADHRCAFSRQTNSARAANTATRSGDQRDLSLDPSHATPQMFRRQL